MLMKEGGGVLTGLVYFETLLMNCGVNCETHTHTHTQPVGHMPQVKGRMPGPITGLSYTAHDPDDRGVTCCSSGSRSPSNRCEAPQAAPEASTRTTTKTKRTQTADQ